MDTFFDLKYNIEEELELRKTHSLWVEKYRPVTLDTFIISDDLKFKFNAYIKSNDIPHLLLYGTPGCGKSTLANILVKNISCDYIYLNASDENGIDTVRDKIKTFVETAGMSPVKVVILDEFDYMTVNAQSALRNIMETYSQTSRFILTCNYVEKIIDPIKSRCQIYNLGNPDMKEVGKFIISMLRSENINFDLANLVSYTKLIQNDIRKLINVLQKQSLTGTLVLDSSNTIANDVKQNILDILKSTDKKENKLKAIRQLIVNAGITNFIDFYKFLYDNVEEYSNGNDALVILVLADMEYQYSFVVDKEINFSACIIKILNTI